MNRTLWIWRIAALAIFLVLTFLMVNLYTKLQRMSAPTSQEHESSKNPRH